MDAHSIRQALDRIKDSDYFESESAALVDHWKAAGVGAEAIPVILRFMEDSPDVLYGLPGRLTKFIEGFPSETYVPEVLKSLARRPAAQTVWMLHRYSNVVESESQREQLLRVIDHCRWHPLADDAVRDEVEMLLDED
ncbi:MAG: hypothetical protein AB7T63_00350 [Planctomycetota bacterium]